MPPDGGCCQRFSTPDFSVPVGLINSGQSRLQSKWTKFAMLGAGMLEGLSYSRDIPVRVNLLGGVLEGGELVQFHVTVKEAALLVDNSSAIRKSVSNLERVLKSVVSDFSGITQAIRFLH